MFTAICKRIGVWVVQKDRLYLLIGVLCLLGLVTLTTNAILTVSNSGMFGDADVSGVVGARHELGRYWMVRGVNHVVHDAAARIFLKNWIWHYVCISKVVLE